MQVEKFSDIDIEQHMTTRTKYRYNRHKHTSATFILLPEYENFLSLHPAFVIKLPVL